MAYVEPGESEGPVWENNEENYEDILKYPAHKDPLWVPLGNGNYYTEKAPDPDDL